MCLTLVKEVNAMAYMVAYDDMLIEWAYGLIKEKSNEDDMKAAEDLQVLDTMVNLQINRWLFYTCLL